MSPTCATRHSTAPLISPRALAVELAPGQQSSETVQNARSTICRILSGEDQRLLIIAGPCSIHNPDEALEYAHRLLELRNRYNDRLYIIMRVYLQKPRTTTGWKGLINDPTMNGSCDIAQGLRVSRKLLLSITSTGMPAGMEILDPVVSHYIGDLTSWVSIGARTSESQIHREMASSLAMPVGFKNGTDGSLESAVNAIIAAQSSHSFLSVDRCGRVCVARTNGNPWGHLVLRGGKTGPNHDSDSIDKACALLAAHRLQTSVLVDCSHMNALKNWRNQAGIWKELVNRRVSGETRIVGLMAESNLSEGNQAVQDEPEHLSYGVSVTDECIGWEMTQELIHEAYCTLGKTVS